MALNIFFFQAEDGIRDYKVTGVQTCALPILDEIIAESASAFEQFWHFAPELQPESGDVPDCLFSQHGMLSAAFAPGTAVKLLKGGEDGIGWTNASPREVVPNWYAVQRSSGDSV